MMAQCAPRREYRCVLFPCILPLLFQLLLTYRDARDSERITALARGSGNRTDGSDWLVMAPIFFGPLGKEVPIGSFRKNVTFVARSFTVQVCLFCWLFHSLLL